MLRSLVHSLLLSVEGELSWCGGEPVVQMWDKACYWIRGREEPSVWVQRSVSCLRVEETVWCRHEGLLSVYSEWSAV